MTYIITGAVITYENGGKGPTGFRTNLLCPDSPIVLMVGELGQQLEERANNTKVPKGCPLEMATPATLWRLENKGLKWRINRYSVCFIRNLDDKTNVFGEVFCFSKAPYTSALPWSESIA